MQNAMNTVWGVPMFRRPQFPKGLLRSLGLIALLGPGEIVTIALSSIAGGTGHLGGALAKVAAVAVSLLLNIVLFWLGFRIATSKEVDGRNMRLSAVLAAIAWQILQLIGGTIIGHATNSAYGAFGSCSACSPGFTCRLRSRCTSWNWTSCGRAGCGRDRWTRRR